VVEYRLHIKPSAAKEIEGIRTKRDRIVVRIQSVAAEPRLAGYEKLAGIASRYRIRQGRPIPSCPLGRRCPAFGRGREDGASPRNLSQYLVIRPRMRCKRRIPRHDRRYTGIRRQSCNTESSFAVPKRGSQRRFPGYLGAGPKGAPRPTRWTIFVRPSPNTCLS